MRAAAFSALATAALALAGCDSTPDIKSGAAEPMVVSNASFYVGALPVGVSGPAVQSIGINSPEFALGQKGKSITGSADKSAYSVGVRLVEAGSGYWIAPVALPDPIDPTQIDWAISASFSRDLAPGDYTLEMVAFDSAGRSGPKTTQKITVDSVIPTGRTVISLRWNNAADLDLVVLTPSGATQKIVSPKHSTTSAMPGVSDGGTDPHVGVLDRDSNASCVQDNFRQEDLVWPVSPEPGTYTVYADMYQACGVASASFDVRLIVDGQVRDQQVGILSAINADNGIPQTPIGTTPNPDGGTPIPLGLQAPGQYVVQYTF
jgi:hypothetical protein